MGDKHADWTCHKTIIAQIKQSRIDKLLEAKIDINLAPLDHLLCLRTKCSHLTIEHMDSIVSLRQQRPFKKLSDLKMIYGIGTQIIEELWKYLKPLPDESVQETDDTVLFVPSTIHQVLTGGLLESSNSMAKAMKNSKNHNNTTFSSDESSVGRPIHRLSHYVLQTSINSFTSR